MYEFLLVQKNSWNSTLDICRLQLIQQKPLIFIETGSSLFSRTLDIMRPLRGLEILILRKS